MCYSPKEIAETQKATHRNALMLLYPWILTALCISQVDLLSISHATPNVFRQLYCIVPYAIPFTYMLVFEHFRFRLCREN